MGNLRIYEQNRDRLKIILEKSLSGREKSILSIALDYGVSVGQLMAQGQRPYSIMDEARAEGAKEELINLRNKLN